MASSSYVVSLGGPPLPDLKYGIIVVPVGEEDLLFAGYGDHAGMSAELKEEIYSKSKATQKEQRAELRQKAAHEWVNGVASEPEIDDDDREFYRKRWRRRRGLPSEEGSERAAAATDDRDPVGQGEDDNETRPIREDVSTASHGQEGSQHSAHDRHSMSVSGHDNETPSVLEDLPMSANRKQDSEHSAHGQSSPTIPANGAAGEIKSAYHLDEHGSEREEVHARERASTRSKGSRTTNQVGDDSVPPAEPNAHVKRDQPRDDGHDGGKISDQQDRPPTSTPSTLRNTESEGAHMSPEACAALEVLLGREEKKRKGLRRVLNSLLPGIRPGKSPDLAVKRQDVLRQVSKALASLADGELRENPGIDRRLWEAAMKDIALKTTP
jgi:hypothetical protein